MKRIIYVLISLLCYLPLSGQMIKNLGPIYKAPIASSGSSSLLTGEIAYWKFDETTGDYADSKNSHTGVNTSVTHYASGKINYAGSYNGTASKTVVTDADDLDLTTAGGISCWIYLGVRTHNYIVTKGDDNNARNGYVFQMEGGYLTLFMLGSSSYMYTQSAAMLSTGQWYHVVATWNSSNVYLYVNGSQSATKAVTVTPVASTYNLQIGAPCVDATGFFNGYIDEVGIWNRLITSTEVTTLYNSGTGKQHPFN
jgi:hypothetical protein